MAGLTAEGFETKTIGQLIDEIATLQRATISTTLNTSTDSVVGQMNGITAAKLRELWELVGEVYAAAFTDSAAGRALSQRAALTGTIRQAATKSRVTATVNVDPGTYAAGSLIASVSGSPTSRFVSIEAAVNGGGSAADVDVVFEAETAGPVRANAGTLTVIAQAVVGWNTVTNAADATAGEDEESDAALRIRREQELRAAGSTTVDAIRSDLLRDVADVSNVNILENDTSTTNGDGVPGHSIECIVYGPASPTADDNQAVAEQIFASKAAGIGTYGSTTRTVVDGAGNSHSISFTRPSIVDAYVQVDLDVDPDTYGGDTAVKEAVEAVATALGPGDALYWTRVIGAPYTVAGVLRVNTFGQSTSGGGPFTQTDITPTVRQLIRITTSNVTVTT